MPFLNKTETEILRAKKLYKITDSEFTHSNFEYKNGLNMNEESLDPKHGLLFSEVEYIFSLFCGEAKIREVTIPENEIVYEDSENHIYRCHSIILSNCRELFTRETLEKLVKEGADIRINNDQPLRNVTYYGYFEAVKYFVEHGANVNVGDDYCLRVAACNGYTDMAKYLVEHGANIHAENDEPLRVAEENGHVEIVEFFKKWDKEHTIKRSKSMSENSVVTSDQQLLENLIAEINSELKVWQICDVDVILKKDKFIIKSGNVFTPLTFERPFQYEAGMALFSFLLNEPVDSTIPAHTFIASVLEAVERAIEWAKEAGVLTPSTIAPDEPITSIPATIYSFPQTMQT